MNERLRPISTRPRWLIVAVLVLLGIALYFWFAPSSRVAAPPVVETE
jgi:multidrug efflux pump subunit AcrA (membrane-fusion protein)